MTTSVILLLLAANMAMALPPPPSPAPEIIPIPDLGLVRPTLEPEIIPITACQDIRDSLKPEIGAPPMLGLYIPDCDEHGNYVVQQCHGSTGHCWCVNQQTGAELWGTRKGPGEGNPNCNQIPPEVSECENECFGVRVCRRSTGCGEKEYDKCMKKCLRVIQIEPVTDFGPSFGLVLPPCISELQNSEAGSEPQCTDVGYYKPQQCLPGRREWDMLIPPECNCVHYETGEEIRGTLCHPDMEDCDKVDCNKFQGCNEETEVFSTCGSPCADECRDGRVVLAGACIEMCEEGCFCREGYLRDTRTGECILEKECKAEPASGPPAPVDSTGPCLKLRQTGKFAPGAEPNCTESGDFVPQKCQIILKGAWTSKFCWCQDLQTGAEIKGTRRGPGENNVDCALRTVEDIEIIEVIEDSKPSTGLTFPPCIDQKMTAEAKAQKKDVNGFEFALEVGPFIPKCSKSGDFEARQCLKDEFQNYECWCVNIKTGKEIMMTRYIRLPGGSDANDCTEINEKMDSCGAYEEFSTCGSACPDMCNEGTKMPPRICTFECEVGCFCQEGYIRDTRTGECIPRKECAEKCYLDGGLEERNDGEEWTETDSDGMVANCKCTAPHVSCWSNGAPPPPPVYIW